jgi:hypothetical protein
LLWRTTIWDHVFAFLAVADPDVSSADKHTVLDAAGSSGATLVRRVAQPLVITTSTLWGSTSLSMNDVYVQRFTPAFEFSSPQLVVSTATQQNGAQVATGSNGYAVAWSEVGPDKNVHAYVRRFTTAGDPYDPQPIEIRTGVASYSVTAPLNVRLASNGNMYVVAWVDSSKVQLRRLADVPGRWLDPQPVAIDFLGDLALASDGKDIMAVGSGQCPKSGDTGCVGTQRIAIGTDIVPGPRVVAKYSPLPAQYAIASNGTDYLVVWSDGAYPCQMTCPSPILSLLALRIRADGTALDPAPQLIEKGSPYGPSVAWNSGRYGVARLDSQPRRGTHGDGHAGRRDSGRRLRRGRHGRPARRDDHRSNSRSRGRLRYRLRASDANHLVQPELVRLSDAVGLRRDLRDVQCGRPSGRPPDGAAVRPHSADRLRLVRRRLARELARACLRPHGRA